MRLGTSGNFKQKPEKNALTVAGLTLLLGREKRCSSGGNAAWKMVSEWEPTWPLGFSHTEGGEIESSGQRREKQRLRGMGAAPSLVLWGLH